ncbi:MAG: hypothetical protein ABTQ24_10175 [Azonexus sp.]
MPATGRGRTIPLSAQEVATDLPAAATGAPAPGPPAGARRPPRFRSTPPGAGAIPFFLLLPLSTVTTWVSAAAMGFQWLGTVPLTNGLIAQIFGLRYMSMRIGVVFLGHQLGGFLGIWLGGRVFDETGPTTLPGESPSACRCLTPCVHGPPDA